MKVVLHEIEGVAVEKYVETKCNKNMVHVEVTYCAICKTDAKIWKEGHRDLVLPRVPGHEMVGKYKGRDYVVWPGIACGECHYCLSGDENLCEEMKILGFHVDGGFASGLYAPEHSLIEVPENMSALHACFAEPAGCVMNAIKKLKLRSQERVLIYGGGTVGLLAALLVKECGADPIVIEKNDTKVLKAEQFSNITSIPVLKDTAESGFDCTINACSDPLAVFSCITRLRKNGRMVHFSGLHKNEQLETNLLNLVHYKELQIVGSYGLTRKDMQQGLQVLRNVSAYLDLLIEDVIEPKDVVTVLDEVYNARSYKYIIDFSQQKQNKTHKLSSINETKVIEHDGVGTEYLGITISKLSREMLSKAQQKIDYKTKPLGALGKLEDLALRIALIQDSLFPCVSNKSLFVCAADHGIAEEGVSAFPQDVTQQMVNNFLNGGAAINVLCRYHNINLSIIDVGLKGERIQNDTLIYKRIAEGTRNFAIHKAMTTDQAIQAIQTGIDVFLEKHSHNVIDVIGLGEMGIANTSSATAIISTITGKTVEECTWRGTGIDDQGLEHKIKVIKKALSYHSPHREDGIDILSKIGGFEIGALAGVALAAASVKCVVVLDGLISTAAGLLAYIINPAVVDYFIAGHRSVEKGHGYALEYMGLSPVLDLNMRLGEGTGAALTIDLVDAACHIMCDMASFEEAGVSQKKQIES